MREIKLTQGKVALVDDADFEELSKHKWWAYYRRSENRWYCARKAPSGVERPRQKTVYMHAVIAGTQPGFDTDHIDGDGLNNTRRNLRVCTRAENQHNQTRKNQGRTSRYRGVSWNNKNRKWEAVIRSNWKQAYLGGFDSEHDAAGAYDVAGIARDPEHFTPNFSASWLAPQKAA